MVVGACMGVVEVVLGMTIAVEVEEVEGRGATEVVGMADVLEAGGGASEAAAEDVVGCGSC